MDTAQMVAFMRKIEQTLPPELNQLVILTKREPLNNGTVINYYDIPDCNRPSGYLWINYIPQTMEILAAEMDVNFPCLIGLNRSPIELRILSNHVLKYIP